jgi:hypothetical protein
VFQALTSDETLFFRRFSLWLESGINIALFRTVHSRGYAVVLSDDWTRGIKPNNSEVNGRNLK